jgi:uncharacterized protein YbjT (DUF2867 family)
LSAERQVRTIVDDFAIIRADWLNQNFSEGFFRDSVLAGQIVMPVGDTKQAFVDAQDIASVALALLTDHRDATGLFSVTGPEALGFADVAAILSEVTGTAVVFDGEPDAYRSLMSGVGAPAEQVETEIATFESLIARGDAVPTTTVRDLTGHKGTSFRDFALAAAKDGAWRTP